MSDSRQVKSWFWLKLISVPVLMFAFAFAMIPMYDVLCEITGLNGKTQDTASTKIDYVVDENRIIFVDFLANTANGFPVDFRPEIDKIEVIPGKIYTINYLARNTSDKVIIGQAIPSVAPEKAATHFKKLECFCFEKQTFLAKQEVKMPVRFIVDPALEASVAEISLSYQFFRLNSKGEKNG